MPHVKENLGDAATVKFHTCPKTAWYKKWADLLRRQNMSKFTSSTVVCSNHFEYGQPRPKSPHPSMYLKGYSVNHGAEYKERRAVVCRSRDKSDEIQENSNEGTNGQESMENLASNTDGNDGDCAGISCSISAQIAQARTKEEYELEICELKMKLQQKEKETHELIVERDKAIEEMNSRPSFGIHSIKHSDDLVKVYTGLPTYALFSWLFEEVKEPAKNMNYFRGEKSSSDKYYQVNDKNKPGPKRKLCLEDELFITLIKLRHNVNIEFIAGLFNVSASLISVTITTWISLLALELKPLIYWPSQEQLKRYYPECFRRYGDNVCAIIDASEVQTERPSMTSANSVLYSNYKQRHTFKVLVACTPGGSISFISEAAGGDMSDVEMVRRSGILEKLKNGDKVLADKGFTNIDDFLMKEVELIIPEFKRKDEQFSLSQNIYNADVSNARIHVERVIGRWKNFKITKGPIPLTMMNMVDKLFFVVGALVNLMGILVPIKKDKV